MTKSIMGKLEWYEKRYGPIIEKRGLHNWKNLFRKPTMQDIIIFILLLMFFIQSYTYNEETKMCRETLTNIESICLQINEKPVITDNIGLSDTNYSEIFKADLNVTSG